MKNSALVDLSEAIKAGQCVPFVGAGLSKMAGLPLWDELIEDMKSPLVGLAETQADKEEELRYLRQALPR